MSRFSERYGYRIVKAAFQREEVNDTLRLALWNVLSLRMWDQWGEPQYAFQPERAKKIESLFKRMWFSYFKKDMDQIPAFRGGSGHQDGYGFLKEHFLRCQWYEVYDLFEWFIQDSDSLMSDKDIAFANDILERENSAYRIVRKVIAEITDQNEIKAIEDALVVPPEPVREHIMTSLQFLSDRETPDYRNSIKEAISAVEASCRLVSGMPSATLGDALKKIPDLHPALQKSFLALYGFTSDANGIRHSLLDEPKLTYADAKFMLSTCSAFVSYLQASSIR
jgi:hypothetical protein